MQDAARAAEAPSAHHDSPLEDPLEQAPPRSRVRASLGQAPSRSRGCASLKQAPPRSRVRSPLEQAPPRSRVRFALVQAPLRSRAPRTRAPAPVYRHLRPDTGGTAPSCARGTLPGAAAPTPQEGAHPHHCGGGGLCGAAGASPVTPCTCSGTANAPNPRRGAGCTLDLLSCDLTGLGGGARPVGRHPCHC
jgi:hypothetical protein